MILWVLIQGFPGPQMEKKGSPLLAVAGIIMYKLRPPSHPPPLDPAIGTRVVMSPPVWKFLQGLLD